MGAHFEEAEPMVPVPAPEPDQEDEGEVEYSLADAPARLRELVCAACGNLIPGNAIMVRDPDHLHDRFFHPLCWNEFRLKDKL